MSGERSTAGGRPWHLPGLERADGGPWHRGETDSGHRFQTPRLDRGESDEVAQEVRRAAREVRRTRTVSQVARAAGEAAGALADEATLAGRSAREVLARELGWPDGLVEETLRSMAVGWAPSTLMELVRAELGDPAVLDGFVSQGSVAGEESESRGTSLSRHRTASGPPLVLQLQAGNVPGVGITGILRGLLVGSGVLVKTSREEPGLAAEFARSLSRRDALLGRAVAVTWWPGGSQPAPAEIWAKRSGKVILYGGREAVAGVRASLPPECDLLVYGPKLGAGIVLSDADLPSAARDLARDVCAYEQRGCVSPRLVFTVDEGRREPFSDLLSSALGDRVKETGRSRLSPGTAAAIRALRADVELGAHGDEPRVAGDPDEVGWTVLSAPEPIDGPQEALPRVVRVYGCADIEEWSSLMAPLEGRIQAVGYAGSQGLEEMAREAADLGACRVAPFGRIAWPPPDWRHDGRHQLLPLLRWTELEGPP